MTIIEALKAELDPIMVADNKVLKALQDQALQPTDVYAPADHERKLDLCYAGLLMKMLVVSEVKEDDISMKFTTQYKPIVSAIYVKWGLVDPYLIVAKIARVTQKIIW